MATDPIKNDWPVPQIDPQKCDGCNLCVQACPNHVIALQDNIAVVVNHQQCDYSGLCEQICPRKAIQRLFEIFIFDEDRKD